MWGGLWGTAFWIDPAQRLVDHGAGRRPLLSRECRGVGEGFEGGAGLARRSGDVDLTVDGLVVVIVAAHHGQDFAGARIERHERAVVHVLPANLVHPPAHDGLSPLLHVHVERGDHPHALPQHVGADQSGQLLAGKEGEVGILDGGLLHVEAKAGGLVGGGGGVFRGNVALAHHGVEHLALAGQRGVGIGYGIVLAGRLHQAGQQGGLGQVKVFGVRIEVGKRRRLHAVGLVAVVDLVEVHRKDLVLGVGRFHTLGEDDLAQLAGVGLLVGEQHGENEEADGIVDGERRQQSQGGMLVQAADDEIPGQADGGQHQTHR